MKTSLKLLPLGWVLFAVLWIVPCQADQQDYLTQVARANDFYSSKHYQKAVDIYEVLISQGVENGYLYYNLGNAHFRLNDLGAAIFNYSRAKKIIPRFEDLDANLRYAIRETNDKIIETHSPNLKNIIFWLDDFGPHEYRGALLMVNLLFWLTLMAWWTFRTTVLGLARNIIFVLLLLIVVSAGARFYSDSQYRVGVVLAKAIDVKSARGMDNVTLFQLHEGAIVNITDEMEEWYKIELAGEKKGWAPKTSIAKS